MKTHVKALVVGGGAVGTAIAYHLARAGWAEVTLLERDELTSGSTWHAAGLLPLFNMGYATSHIHDYSVRFYKTLEEETGLNPGFLRGWQPAHGADTGPHGRIHALCLDGGNRGHPL
jgi:dimethylglycine dehydrogenase